MALTDDVNLEEKEGVVQASPVGGSVRIFRGAMVMHGPAGYLIPAAAQAGAVFAGIAEQSVDNSSGAAGDVTCRHKIEGVYLMKCAGFTQADVGEQVYAEDDESVTKTVGNNVPVGQVVKFVSATQVWVKLDENPAAAV